MTASVAESIMRARAYSWSDAWRLANAGPDGFYRSQRAEEQFTTSPHVDSSVAGAVASIVEVELQRQAGEPLTVLDIGSGSGQLLRQLKSLLPGDVELVGVDLRERPDDLPATIDWIEHTISSQSQQITDRDGAIRGVVIAHEFLDDVPCDVVELDEQLQPRVVLVDPVSGAEELGPHLADPACMRYVHDPAAAAQWLTQWWPPTRPLARREVGLERDRVWARLRSVLRSGTAVAVDYGHTRADRVRGVWDGGTIKGFAEGRPCSPRPDGSCNITAHVALDACAGEFARLARQTDMLPEGSLTGFPGGLGSFEWLIDPVVER